MPHDFYEFSLRDIISLAATLAIFVIGYVIERKARKIQNLMTWKEFREPVIAFANETLDILSEVEGLCETNPEILKQDFWNKYNFLINKISSLRDKGKLLIPNHTPEKYGQPKSSAYKGIRQKSLDCLKAAYYLTIALNYKTSGNNVIPASLIDNDLQPQARKIKEALNYLPRKVEISGLNIDDEFIKGWSCKQGIVESKRQFLSEIQDLVDTKTWIENIAEFPPKKKKAQ